MERDERIENKLDKMAEDMTEVKITLAKQHIVLVEHESRSTKLETLVLPIHRKVLMLEGALKLIGMLAVVLGIIQSIRILIR